MCTRESYRVESLTWLKKDGERRYWIVDGRSEVEQYNPKFFKVSRIQCGSCLECRLSKAKEWAFRCVKEAKYHENNIMITLTYNDEHLPKSKGIDAKTGEVYESSTLNHRDVQLFMKRLRKKFKDVRMFGCGEYGSHEEYVDTKGKVRKGTERPHYHIILFNIKFKDMYFWRWSRCEWNPKVKNALYRSKTLEKLWSDENGQIGNAELNEVNFETCRYVAGYVTKKYKGSDSKEHYELKGQKPPYTFSSRRPGIANEFYEENKEKFFNETPLFAVTKKGLKRVKSRYFDKLMEKDDPNKFEDIRRSRRKKSEEAMTELLRKTDIDKHTYIENQESKVETRNRLLKIRK